MMNRDKTIQINFGTHFDSKMEIKYKYRKIFNCDRKKLKFQDKKDMDDYFSILEGHLTIFLSISTTKI